MYFIWNAIYFGGGVGLCINLRTMQFVAGPSSSPSPSCDAYNGWMLAESLDIVGWWLVGGASWLENNMDEAQNWAEHFSIHLSCQINGICEFCVGLAVLQLALPNPTTTLPHSQRFIRASSTPKHCCIWPCVRLVDRVGAAYSTSPAALGNCPLETLLQSRLRSLFQKPVVGNLMRWTHLISKIWATGHSIHLRVWLDELSVLF